MTSNSDAAEKFWAFSLKVYAMPDVEQACLRLQYDHNLDVNVVLFCAWAGQQGISLDKAAFAEQIAAANRWQELAVQPIRGIRRRLKDLSVAGLSIDGRDGLRETIKAAELQAEQLEQAILVTTVIGLPEAGASVALADANFDAYWRITGPDDLSSTNEAWQIIRAAAFPHETNAQS